MRVLITGSAGFIGSALALRLLERGDEVIGVDCLDTYYDGFHYTPAGARSVATLVAAAVLRLPVPHERLASRAS